MSPVGVGPGSGTFVGSLVTLWTSNGRSWRFLDDRSWIRSYDGLRVIESSETGSELGPQQLASRAVADIAANARHQSGADQRGKQDLEAGCVVMHEAFEAARGSHRAWSDVPEVERAPIRAGVSELMAADWFVEAVVNARRDSVVSAALARCLAAAEYITRDAIAEAFAAGRASQGH